MTRIKVIKHEDYNFSHYSRKLESEIKDFISDKKVLRLSQSFNPLGAYTTIIYETVD